MRALVVLAHPEPKSFNAQLAHCAAESLSAAGYEVEISDLYRQNFDPREAPRHYRDRSVPDWFDAQAEQRHASEHDALPPDVTAELEKVERADLLILQFPMWWFSFPAMMKGWFDRVLVYGRSYSGKMRYDRGRFRGRRAMLSVTFGGPQATFAHNGRNGDVDLLLWPMNMCLNFVGYSVLPSFTAFGVEGGLKYTNADEMVRRLHQHKSGLQDLLRKIDDIKPLPFNGWDDWDENGQLRAGVRGHSLFMRAEP